MFWVSIWGQFHQRSTCSFYLRKLRTQLFHAYILGLYFTGVSLPAQKLGIELWWNWAMVTLYLCFSTGVPRHTRMSLPRKSYSSQLLLKPVHGDFFELLLNWALFFEAARSVVQISLSLRSELRLATLARLTKSSLSEFVYRRTLLYAVFLSANSRICDLEIESKIR